MMSTLQAAWVIGRRDFTATVFSRAFFLFLAGPLVILAFSIGAGSLGARMARQDLRTNVAVVAGKAEFDEIMAAHARMRPVLGELPTFVRADPEPDRGRQVDRLLSASDTRILAVLTGGVDAPRLIGAVDRDGRTQRQVTAVLQDVRAHRVLASSGISVPPVKMELVRVGESAGSLAKERSMTSRLGQMLLFMLTIFLASMLLSNLAEEKSNKVIEVLTAAVPVDAIFYGKLVSMLAISLLGICVWTAAGALAMTLYLGIGPQAVAIPAPAVGWPVFLLLVFLYFGANYLLLGALFLGIGSQANSLREVQTLSMPVTMSQLLIFLFAQFAAGSIDSVLGIAAAIFPFSSPLTMIARAAQAPVLWPHAAALAWQALWVWLTVQFGAALFRRNVMKSGGGMRRLRKAKA
jgi:ABC-2 type transport system permease protein